MAFIDGIFSLVWDISEYFRNMSSETAGWVWPFSWLQYPFAGLSSIFGSLLTPIAQAHDWVQAVWSKVSEILDEAGILAIIRTFLEAAAAAWEWVPNTWNNIKDAVLDWWETAKTTVLGWIDIAKTNVLDIIDTVKKLLGGLQEKWDNFSTLTWPQWIGRLESLLADVGYFFNVTLPGLITIRAARDLVDSTLKRWFPFYDDLVYLWRDIKLFFVDPLQWVYDKLDEFFERFW